MSKELTLKGLFESHKDELANHLSNFSLPNDASKIQKTVSDYLNLIIENEGEYRQHLTQAEDYILQAALGLLNAQQNIAKEINNPKTEAVSSQKSEKKYVNPYTSLIGTTVGGALGAFGGTWGAVFGAIAGTAVVLYCATTMPSSQTKTASPDKQITKPTIRTEVFLDIVKNICDSIDNLIETFRTQIKRVENVYEQKEKPSLQKDYSLLLTSIQELVIVSNTECDDKEKKLHRLEKKVNDLAESLENYGVAIVDGKITDLKE